MSKSEFSYFNKITDPDNALHFADAAYNGGRGGVNKDRRACTLVSGCNPKIWFNNVERTCTKSKVALYGKRSACDINRHHVTDVIKHRSPKYSMYIN